MEKRRGKPGLNPDQKRLQRAFEAAGITEHVKSSTEIHTSRLASAEKTKAQAPKGDKGTEQMRLPDPDCTHHWQLPRPNGRTSHGICKHCLGERDFQNSFYDFKG